MKSLLKGTVKGSARLPPSDIHGINMMEKLRMVLHVLLGVNYPIIARTTSFISNWRAMACHLMAREPIVPQHTKVHMPALVLRYYQVHLCCWIETQWDSSEDLEVPKFSDMFDHEGTRSYVMWEKSLPAG